MSLITVAVIDDYKGVANSISQMLDGEDGIEVVGVAYSVNDGVVLVREHKPRVAVIDYRFPESDGLTLAARIKEVSPNTSIVMLTGLSLPYPESAHLAHISKVVDKAMALSDLVDAIRSSVH